jgi:urease accessory protein
METSDISDVSVNVIDSTSLERDMQISLRNLHEFDCAEKPVSTFSHPALRLGIGAAGYLLFATNADAHFNAPGLSDFNAGVLHPLLTVQHAMVLTAFGLLCGQSGVAHLRFGLPGLAVGLVAGFSIAEAGFPSADAIPLALTILAFVAGSFVASNYRLPAPVCLAMGLIIGGLIGLDSNPETSVAGAQLAGISGTSIAVLLLFLNIAGLATFASAEWQCIGIRVAGSWMSAAAFLNIALLFRK